MADWLMELVEQKRRKAIEDQNARPAPKDGRTRAELIYGRTRNDEESRWSLNTENALLKPESSPREAVVGPVQTPPPTQSVAASAAAISPFVSVAPNADPTADTRARAERIYGIGYGKNEPSRNWDGPPASESAMNGNMSDTGIKTASSTRSVITEHASAPKPDSEIAPVESKRPFDIDKAARFIKDHAAKKPTGYCAKHVRKALQYAGLNLPEYPANAKDYGDYLEWAGLSKIDKVGYTPKKGDLIVMQPEVRGKPGHFQMYDGEAWISDHVQNANDIYPSKRYRDAKPPYEIYR